VAGEDPDDSRTDTALMAAHAAGDRTAFEELVRRHRDRLWAVALRTTGDREEAADALQDALVKAFRAGPSSAFRGESAVTTWLHRIVVNACLDRGRRRAVRPTDPWPERDVATPGADAIASRETALDVTAALATLPEDQRAALVLVDMYGWSVEEAATALDCPTGTVKSRCARGRARLLPLLRTDAPPPERPGPRNQPLTGGVPPQTSPVSTPASTRTDERQQGGEQP
jgi:RNA polymerase sigma-70 factor (ECF subfamily)